ncbi:MAG: low molecular weight protein arginine phosphatase [bacterium]
MNILFVCTGNLNRSPMAAALLHKFLSRAGRDDLSIRSAGTHAFEGSPAPANAIEVANQAGIDLSPHMTQPISRELVDWADRIVVMSPEHIDFIEVNFPDALDKIEEMASFRVGARPGDSVKDPNGLSPFHYRQYFGELMEAVQGYFSSLQNIRS